MHKKHIFLRVFSKITIFACVFCAVPAWSDTTTCDINFTPVTGNSWQNGTPTPTNPVAIESIGTKIGNKYQIPVVVQGKNLFDSDIFLSVTGWQKNGDEYFGNMVELFNKYFRNGMISFNGKPNTQYTFSYNIKMDGTIYGGRARIIYSDNSYTDLTHYSSTDKPNYIKVTGTSENGKTIVGIKFPYTDGTGNAYLKEFIIEEGNTATPYAPYGHSTTPIYLNAPLRKVGDYADVLDYKNGTITRNVGVKVFDGTENWGYATSSDYERFILLINNLKNDNSHTIMLSNSYIGYSANAVYSQKPELSCWIEDGKSIRFHNNNISSVNEWKAYLAAQYAAGTPVTVYYPLATPVVEQIENWSCPVPITDIKIATTKMVDEEFAQAEANLAATVQTIESVVSRTIAQTGQIATLHETKQTRPDENCPANMKCLLVQDEDGTPHWYPIIEP